MLRLTRGRDFRLIWMAGTVSQLGDWAARLALALLVLAREGGPTAVGVVGALFVVPWLGIGQLLTSWSTRFGRRVVMIACDTLRGIAFVAIGSFDMPMILLLFIVFLAALADPVFEATKSAFVVELVPKKDYADAIQVTHAANQASSLVGYALGGLLVGFYGASVTLVLNGFTFILSSLLVVLVSRPGLRASEESSAPSLAAGLKFLRDDRISAIGFGATVLAAAAAMSVESQVAVYGKLVAEFEDSAIGLLSAATPAATLLAVALMKTSIDDAVALRRGIIITGCAAAGAAAMLLVGVGGPLAFVAFALVGVMFGFPPITNVVVGRRLPDENRVAIFSILQTGVFLGLSAGALLGGVLSDAMSPELAAGGALLVAMVGLFAMIPILQRQS